MKKLSFLTALLLFVPLSVSAQTFDATNATTLVDTVSAFINTLVPLVFAVAFLVFIWGIMVFLIAGGANEEKREEGKKLAVWGIIAFLIMTSVWGIVNIVRTSFTLDESRPSLPTFPTS